MSGWISSRGAVSRRSEKARACCGEWGGKEGLVREKKNGEGAGSRVIS